MFFCWDIDTEIMNETIDKYSRHPLEKTEIKL